MITHIEHKEADAAMRAADWELAKNLYWQAMRAASEDWKRQYFYEQWTICDGAQRRGATVFIGKSNAVGEPDE